MENYVYIIKNEKGDQYVGMSAKPLERLISHNQGKVKSTKNRGIWKILNLEKYSSRIEARKREKYLKSAAGRRFRKFLTDR